MFASIIHFFEKYAFGVCEWWGKKLGIRSTKIRLYFIYTAFITLGSTFLVYLIMAFLLEHKSSIKNLFRSRRSSVWDI